MRTAIIRGPRQLSIVEQPLPAIGGSQLLVRLEGCGVCASNGPVWEGRPWFEYPRDAGSPGHEGWGIVEDVGSEVTRFGRGDRVAILSYRAFAEFDVAEQDDAVLLPPSLDGIPAPGEPLGCAVNVFRRSDILAGQQVAVVGVGFLGALLVQLASQAGAEVIAITRRAWALELAERCGAKYLVRLDDFQRALQQVRQISGYDGCPRVIEAVGLQGTLDFAAELVGTNGKLVVAGYHQDGLRQVNMQSWNWRGIDVINAHERDPKVYVRGIREAIEKIDAGTLDPRPLVTHRFPLESLAEALEASRRRPDGFLKAVIDMPGSAERKSTRRAPARRGEVRSRGGPRLGFVGVGWIGLNRLRAARQLTEFQVCALADTSAAALERAGQAAPGAERFESYEDLLNLPLDGVVIATPSGLHAVQACQAIEAGKAVFCQKPLARTADEARRVIHCARNGRRLLGVDLSYRYVGGVAEMRHLVRSGELGTLFAADLVFHNAYGPDKAWFYDARESGGGCLIDLGTHLVDLLQWVTGNRDAQAVNGHLFRSGRRLGKQDLERGEVEDYAQVAWNLASGPAVRLACSWRISAGCDAVIEAAFYGSQGAVRLRNVNGSFYDFVVERMEGTNCRRIASPPDEWGGRCFADWCRRLARENGYDASIEDVIGVADILDRCYGR